MVVAETAEIVLPDEIHGFPMWKTCLRVFAATTDFFDRTLKGGENQR